MSWILLVWLYSGKNPEPVAWYKTERECVAAGKAWRSQPGSGRYYCLKGYRIE